jgi:hypothetical protein
MAFPCETYLEFLTGYVCEEFRHLYAQLKEFLGKEHNGDGTHGAITATSLSVTGNLSLAGTQGGGLEAGHGNVVVGDQSAASAAIGGYGIKIGRWRIIEDRTGPTRDLLFQNPDLDNVEHLFKFAAQGGIEWALQPGLGAALRVGTTNLPLVSVAARRVDIGGFGAFIESGTGSPEGVLTAPVGSLWLRSNGGAGSTLYVKESGAGNTGWRAV